MPLASRGVTAKVTQNVLQAYRASLVNHTSASRPIHNDPKLIKTPTNPTSKYSVSSIAATPAVLQEVERCFNKLDLSFTNTKEAFKV